MMAHSANAQPASGADHPRWRHWFSIASAVPKSDWQPLAIFVAIALCMLGLFSTPAMAQTNRATVPANFDQMVMYGDYRRGSDGELAYALPETIAIAQSGQTLPPGTHLVLEIYNDDALVSYFVMAKGEGWGLDFAEEDRPGDWHFQQFGTDRAINREAITDRCVACHQGAAEDDFMFTWC